jgi:hypothetical protein
MANVPFDNAQDRAKAAKEPDNKSQASFNQQENAGITNQQPKVDDHGRTGRDQEEEGRMRNETAVRQQDELRSERDHGYGSEYIGNEYKDVKVEDKTDEEEAA